MADLATPLPSERAADIFARASAGASEPVAACVAFFDLVGSTELKIERGHRVGAIKALEFVALAAVISEDSSGEVIQSLGDGLLVRFADPLNGCRAAVSLKNACVEHGIRSTAGLAFGLIEDITTDRGRVIIGATVDRAARLQSLALPGQTLIDSALMEAARSFLGQYRDVAVSDALQVNAKGLTTLEVHELSLRSLGLAKAVVPPFEIYPEGRMSIRDKTRFARQATREIKEFGTGLTAFAKYFTGSRPEEFKDHIRDILTRGVDLNCYGLAPDSQWVEFVKETSGEEYVEEAARARAAILKERNAFLARGLPGELRYFEYDHVPEFHGFCIDPDDGINAQIMISFYLPGMTRAEAPVYQVARSGQPELFDKYRIAMRAVEATAEQVDR